MTTSSLRDAFIRGSVERDASFVGRIFGSLNRDHRLQQVVASPFSLGLTPYICLFAHEAQRQLERIDPMLTASLEAEASQAVAASRNSLKMFEDSKRGIEGQVDYFRSSVRTAHRGFFRSGLGRWFGSDLGVCTYSGQTILTSHSATVALGLDPADLLAQASSADNPVVRIGAQVGRFFGPLGAEAAHDDPCFVSNLESSRFRWRNLQADSYYRNLFPGVSVDFAAVLDWIRTTNAFALLLLDSENDDRSRHVVLKIRFLAAYQVARSLGVLYEGGALSDESAGWRRVSQALHSQPVAALVAEHWRPLRNTLVHYGPADAFDLPRLDMDEPLFGLVSQCDPRFTWPRFADLVNESLWTIQSAFSTWASR